MTYDFHPEARLEYREAATFYESRHPGLGAAFTLEVEAAIQRIVGAPSRWQLIEEDVRRTLTHTFPYAIVYTVESNSILIISVMHLRRRPDFWRSRVLDNPL